MPTQLNTRVDDDFAELVENYRERERMESQAEALRELLRVGLKEEEAWFEATADGGLTAEVWAAERLGKWADRSMYASLFVATFGIAIGLPIELGLVDPTLPLAVIFLLSSTLFSAFAVVGGILSLIGVYLYIRAGVEFKEALPWRRPT